MIRNVFPILNQTYLLQCPILYIIIDKWQQLKEEASPFWMPKVFIETTEKGSINQVSFSPTSERAPAVYHLCENNSTQIID